MALVAAVAAATPARRGARGQLGWGMCKHVFFLLSYCVLFLFYSVTASNVNAVESCIEAGT